MKYLSNPYLKHLPEALFHSFIVYAVKYSFHLTIWQFLVFLLIYMKYVLNTFETKLLLDSLLHTIVKTEVTTSCLLNDCMNKYIKDSIKDLTKEK
jgi:Ca2+/Na+ antiporter